MNDPKRRQWCCIYSNNDFIHALTYSGWRSTLIDPEHGSFHLAEPVPDRELGAAILSALAASRFVDPRVEPEFFDARGRGRRVYEAWVAGIMSRHRYRTRRAMFRELRTVGVELEDGTITFRPSHHDRLEGWSGEGVSQDNWVQIEATAVDCAVGEAARVALRRCT